MGILIKFTLKNIKEKKFRLFLIIISVTLSSALFFASVAISANVEQIYATQMRRHAGNSDITVSADRNYRSSFFYQNQFSVFKENTEYMIGSLSQSGIYQSKEDQEIRLYIRGFTLEDLKQLSPVTYIKKNENEAFEGKQIIIGYKDANEYDLDVEDSIEIESFGGNKVKVKVWAIVNNSGLFQLGSSGSTQMTMVMPKDTCQRLSGVPGKISVLYIKANAESYYDLQDNIKNTVKGFEVEESISVDELKAAIAQISAIFQIMLVLVVFISVFIIYTSFKVIMMERLPIIGTFRSVGATKRSTNLIMLGESLAYGLTGGALGLGLGMIILKVMTNMLAYNPYNHSTTEIDLTFGVVNMVATLILAVGLSVVSSALPIIKVSKIPVKDIVLNNIERQNRSLNWKKYSGSILFIVPLIMVLTPIGKVNIIIDILLLIISIIGLIFLIPYIMQSFVWFFEKTIAFSLGNEAILAVKSLKENKNITNNIILMTIGIASLLMINVLSYSVGIEVANVYNDGNFEIWSWIGHMDKVSLNKVRTIEGVEDVMGTYDTWDVELVGIDGDIGQINGINPYEYFDYWQFPIIGDKDSILKKLDEGRNIILNKSLADKYNLEVGDIIVLKLNNKDRSYKLIGMTNTLMNNGQVNYISEKYYKKDIPSNYYDNVFVRTNQDPAIVNERLQKKFQQYGVWSKTLEDLQKSNEDSNRQLFIMLQGFSVLTMVIGLFGVFNNYIVSMLSRKRALAMYRSIGMSVKQMRKMLFLEALFGGIFGGIMGIIGGLIFILFSKYMMLALDLPVAMHVNVFYCIGALIGGVTVSLIASIGPVSRSTKINIIEAIKYE